MVSSTGTRGYLPYPLMLDIFLRMSEPNLMSIVEGVEEAYRKHSRHGQPPCFFCIICTYTHGPKLDVLSVLTNLLINGIAAYAILLDSYVILHAALVASLHRVIGIEFGKKKLTIFFPSNYVTHIY
jgi:hypothetical protein